MFKSIFGKQFAAYAGTLTVSFAVVGFVLVGMFQSYFTNQKTDALIEQGGKLANSYYNYYYARNFMISPFGGGMSLRRPDGADIINEMDTLNTYLGASCFFVNENFEVMAFSSGIETLELDQKIDIAELMPVMKGEVVTVNTNPGGIFTQISQNVLTVGYPIMDVRGTIYGAVFMHASMAEVQKTTRDVVTITVICLISSLVAAFILIYITSRTISRPIHQISEAARVIAGGDFEKRLDVRSRDEVGMLASSFNHMAESLENTERHRREFIANISHDLRSPLTSMKGFLRAIIDGTIPTENQGRYLEIVLNESDRLSKLANDILDISKIQNLEIELSKTDFDIIELIRKTVIMFETSVTSKSLTFGISFDEDKAYVNADAEKIQRVLFNLIDNAVKFTPSGGAVTVKTFSKNDGKIYVSIKDTGPGISADDQKRVFDRFFKADASRGQDKNGSGLGLSIVREFIKAHGETIEVYSEPGSGCEFVFGLVEL